MRALLNSIRSRGEHRLPAGISRLQPCTVDDYCAWYLEREARKGRRFRQPADAAGRRAMMAACHAGKFFPSAHEWEWWRASIQSPEALAALVIPRSNQSIADGLIDPVRPRTVGVAVDRLTAARFFERADPPGAEPHPFRRYYRRFLRDGLKLCDGDRLALRSLTRSEQDEMAGRNALYLLDGVGRSLPYLTLVRQCRLRFRPVEVYLALAPPRIYRWPAAEFHHATGEAAATGGGWRCIPGRHRRGHAVFGPYLSLPQTPVTVTFKLNMDRGRRGVARVEVYDANRRRTMASQLVHEAGRVALPFLNHTTNPLEFRVFWYGRVGFEVEWVELALGRTTDELSGLHSASR